MGKVLMGAAVLAALAVGGAGLASAQTPPGATGGPDGQGANPGGSNPGGPPGMGGFGMGPGFGGQGGPGGPGGPPGMRFPGMGPGMNGPGMGGPGMGGPGMGGPGMGGPGMGGPGRFGPGGPHAMMMGRPPRAAVFAISRGDTRMMIKCSDEESTKVCVDAAGSLLDKLAPSTTPAR